MPCYHVDVGGMPAIICGKLGPHCIRCRRPGAFQCDYPVGERGRTCDAYLCAEHAHQIGPDRHLCPLHLTVHSRERFSRTPTMQQDLPL